jgi:4'-phosphopantetheinyl transferase
MSSAPRASVHLWVALARSADGPVLTAACRRLMTDEELRRESRFVHERDRSTYRLARALTRSVLARYVDADPLCLVFARSPHGRPSILHPGRSDLDFSISHTPGIALLLVASGRIVGVDVEKVTRSPAIGAVSRMFASSELADLQARSGEDRRRRFLQYWTLKESYAKARGGGLSLPLDECRFNIDAYDETVTATIDAALDQNADGWSFALATPAPGFLAAVTVSCDERLGAPSLEIREARLQVGRAARPCGADRDATGYRSQHPGR